MKRSFGICLGALGIFFAACNSMEYSPDQIFDRDSPRDLNIKNLQSLETNKKDDTIRFVITGDSQREYASSADFVNTVNKIPGVDFVLLDGDISDFGLLQEMEWIDDIFSKLNVPYFGVLGNHDVSANGRHVFERMFGDVNFSFVYQGIKFVCHNTNSREFNFDGSVPDLSWLQEQFADEEGTNGYVAVGHVPPNDGDFDVALADRYTSIINGQSKSIAAFYAHIHTEDIFYPNDGRVPYIVTDAIEHRQFILAQIINEKLSFERIAY